jgi:hypothetical protein
MAMVTNSTIPIDLKGSAVLGKVMKANEQPLPLGK